MNTEQKKGKTKESFKTPAPEEKAAGLKVVVRMRTEIYDPSERTTRTYDRGYVFEKPWKELIEQAEADKKHRILSIIKNN